MGGDTLKDCLEDYYCLRGLEPYQSSLLNSEWHSQRYMYVQAVLSEQAKVQRCSAPSEKEHARQHMSHLLCHMSSYATRRAQALAAKDATESQQYLSGETGKQQQQQQQQTSLMKSSRRMSMQGPLVSGKDHHHHSYPRPHKLQLTLRNTAVATRAPVDVEKLRAMNMHFLQKFMSSTNDCHPNGPLPQQASNDEEDDDGTTLLQDCHATLESVLHYRQQQQQQQQQHRHLRRHSLHSASTQMANEDSFLAIRRDSLHGLGYNHHRNNQSSSSSKRHARR